MHLAVYAPYSPGGTLLLASQTVSYPVLFDSTVEL